MFPSTHPEQTALSWRFSWDRAISLPDPGSPRGMTGTLPIVYQLLLTDSMVPSLDHKRECSPEKEEHLKFDVLAVVSHLMLTILYRMSCEKRMGSGNCID